MQKLFIDCDDKNIGYYITYRKGASIPDEDIVATLDILLEDYQNILKKYGAYGDGEYGECYFKKKKDAQYCLQCLEQEINCLKESNKCLCEKGGLEDSDIRIIKNEQTGKWELQVWGWFYYYGDNFSNTGWVKINSMEIEFCFKCGKKLI